MKGEKNILKAFASGKIYSGFLMAGLGGLDVSIETARAYVAGGINLLEIGIPFSDPIADGPIISRAAQSALASGTTLATVLALIGEIRKFTKVPIVIFSYSNPLLCALKSNFFESLAQAGVDGILIIDLALERKSKIYEACLKNEIAPIAVIAPSTNLERLKELESFGKGFLYYACQKGVTGARRELPENLYKKMKWLKSNISLPLLVGFGISSKSQAKEVLTVADGVVVGSYFIDMTSRNVPLKELQATISQINPLQNEVYHDAYY